MPSESTSYTSAYPRYIPLVALQVVHPQIPRPKMELALPYGAYRLVRTDGSAPERADKHPFCMSRVYYDPCERPEEVGIESGTPEQLME